MAEGALSLTAEGEILVDSAAVVRASADPHGKRAGPKHRFASFWREVDANTCSLRRAVKVKGHSTVRDSMPQREQLQIEANSWADKLAGVANKRQAHEKGNREEWLRRARGVADQLIGMAAVLAE